MHVTYGDVLSCISHLCVSIYTNCIPLKYGMEINIVKSHFLNMFVTLETVLISFIHVCNLTEVCGR
jgi:hypothetical protein